MTVPNNNDNSALWILVIYFAILSLVVCCTKPDDQCVFKLGHEVQCGAFGCDRYKIFWSDQSTSITYPNTEWVSADIGECRETILDRIHDSNN